MLEVGEYAVYYRILLIEMFANVIDISWFFQGIEDFRRTATRNIIIKIVSVVSIFIFVKSPNDLYKFIFICVLTNLFGNLALWIKIKKYIVKVKFNELNVLGQLKPTITLFIPQIAIQIYTIVDRTMIGSITGNMSEVGFYEQAQKMVKIVLTVITSLGTVMMPRIAKCYADGENEQIENYMHKTFRFVYMLAFPLIFGIIVVSDKFVPSFFGEGYDKVKILLKFLSWIILFIGMSNVTGSQYMISTKKQSQFTISVVVGAIINLILNSILIRHYQSLGAVISTICAELSVTLIQFYFIRDKFKLINIIKLAKNYLIASLIMFGITFVIGLFIESYLVCIFTQAAVGAIIYFIIITLFKDELFREILKRFKLVK